MKTDDPQTKNLTLPGRPACRIHVFDKFLGHDRLVAKWCEYHAIHRSPGVLLHKRCHVPADHRMIVSMSSCNGVSSFGSTS